MIPIWKNNNALTGRVGEVAQQRNPPLINGLRWVTLRSTHPTKALRFNRIGMMCVVLLLFAVPLVAQEAKKPVLEITFEQTEAIPGQALSLRITVLVPTFLPSPPVWPSLEAPNLLVRLPERSTGPTSKKIGQETWSGVTRHYRITPMVAGHFSIPPQRLIVTYADPETNAPLKVTLTTEPIDFAGVAPEGSEGLDPFIAAESLQLKQTIDGEPAAMVPGDSVVRTVTATIRGTSAMFLPNLLPPTAVEGVAAYPDEPVLETSDDRGVLSGIRTERVTLFAEGGGEGAAPPVSLDWYSFVTGQVETAKIEGFDIAVDGPPARRAEARDGRSLVFAVLAALLALGLGAWLAPLLHRWVRTRRSAWLASEAHAYAQLHRIVQRHNYAALYPALDAWFTTLGEHDLRRHPRLQAALIELGHARYGRNAAGNIASAWRALAAALADVRRASRKHQTVATALPPLNPGASITIP